MGTAEICSFRNTNINHRNLKGGYIGRTVLDMRNARRYNFFQMCRPFEYFVSKSELYSPKRNEGSMQLLWGHFIYDIYIYTSQQYIVIEKYRDH